MYPIIKAEWVKALRSGKYKQTTGRLARNSTKNGETSYCCLGVLCEVAMGLDVPISKTSSNGINYKYDGKSDILPETVISFAGLGSPEPEVDYGGYNKTPITVLNDDAGLTFAELADIIEAQL